MAPKTIRLVEQPAVGDGITLVLWTDAHAYTVTNLIGTTAFLAQRDKATRTNRAADVVTVGGFFAHTETNGPQEWSYERDLDGNVERISRRKDGTWRPRGGGMKAVRPGRHEYYDYNF